MKPSPPNSLPPGNLSADWVGVLGALKWLGDRKGMWPIKLSASGPFGMAVNVSGRGTA